MCVSVCISVQMLLLWSDVRVRVRVPYEMRARRDRLTGASERASVAATLADESNAGGRVGVPLLSDMQAEQVKAMCTFLCNADTSSLSSLLLLLGGNSLNGGRGTGSAGEDGAGPVGRWVSVDQLQGCGLLR